MMTEFSIWLQEKWQSMTLTQKRVLAVVVGTVVGFLLARYGSLTLLKLIGISPEYKAEAAFFLLAASIPPVVWIFNTLEKLERAAKIKFYLAVAGVVGVCALGLYALSKKSPK